MADLLWEVCGRMYTAAGAQTAGRQTVTAAEAEKEEAMDIEVRADGSILVDGKLMGRTNNPEEVRRRLYRRLGKTHTRAA